MFHENLYIDFKVIRTHAHIDMMYHKPIFLFFRYHGLDPLACSSSEIVNLTRHLAGLSSQGHKPTHHSEQNHESRPKILPVFMG
jgi:hypothetical protein